MPTWILTAFGFVAQNVNLFAYGAAAVAIGILAFNLYNGIREGAVKDILLKQQVQTIKDKEAFIKFQQGQLALQEEFYKDLESKNLVLETQYNRIVIDTLGADVTDQAPPSLKELIRQLKKETGR